MKKNKIHLLHIDFQYCVDLSTETYSDCESNGCDSICRCSTIINEEIRSVDMNLITLKLYDNFFDDSLETTRNLKIESIIYGIDKPFYLYSINRILVIKGLWKKENWKINISNGYYGEEIESVTIENKLAIKLQELIKESFSIKEKNKIIEFLIKLEYGKLLPEMIGKKYREITIDKSDIVFGSKINLIKTKLSNLDHYSDDNYNNIRGIVIKRSDGKYRLIDGYNRCYATDKNKVSLLEVF